MEAKCSTSDADSNVIYRSNAKVTIAKSKEIQLASEYMYTTARICKYFMTGFYLLHLTLNLPTTTIVAQPFNIIKWQVKFNPVA